MATPATTERKAPTRRRAPKAEHLSMTYPRPCSAFHPHFWIASYLADLAERVAMEHLRHKIHSKVDNVTQMALCRSDTHYFHSMNESVRHVRDHGLLLYAWPGTKLFTNPEARH